jgi:hypothetical protein
MPAYVKNALPVLVVGLLSISAAAQLTAKSPNANYSAARQDSDFRYGALEPTPLTLNEGLAVLGAALDSRHHRGFTSDCSHFVHGLYQRAGFPYAYASSTEIYSGIGQFERVTSPQAGDLVAWRGHVGIVVNPVQHSFFSLLRSGAGVEVYDSPYWKRRGHPRFFRYIKANPGSGVATSLRNASLDPSEADDAGSRELAADGADEPAISRQSSARRPDSRPPSRTIPLAVVVNSARPTPDQVRSAFLQSCTDSEESLRASDIFQSAQPVIVFDRFVVRKLHVSGTQGWAEVEIDELAFVNAGRSEARNHSERQRWPLVRRAQSNWDLTPPQRTIYLPQNIAAHLTAQRLAQLTKDTTSNSDANQKTELAQLLNVLLGK